MLALHRAEDNEGNGVDVLYGQELNPWIDDCCPPEFVLLYKSLVGDPSDGFKGAAGFGPAKFKDLFLRYGKEGMETMLELVEQRRLNELEEDAPDFPPLMKIIQATYSVYTSYACAKFYPERINTPANPLQIRMQIGVGTEDIFGEWNQTKTLVTTDNFESCKPEIARNIAEAPFVAIDIETDVYEESLAWMKAIQENVRKDAIKVDVTGSVIVGMSITCGVNRQHTYYFSVRHNQEPDNNIDSLALRDFLMPLLLDKRTVAHNASGFELPVVCKEWDQWLPNMHCTRIAASYVDENELLGLKPCSRRYFDYDQMTYDEVTQGRGMADMTAEETFDYGCDDTITGSALYQRCMFTMELENTWDVYDGVETSSQYAAAKAMMDGFPCDLEVLKELKAADDEKMASNIKAIKTHLTRLGWEGSVCKPLEDLSSSEIKRGYFMINGAKLGSRCRGLDKLAEAAGGVYGELLLTGDLGLINAHIVENFTPSMNFKPNSSTACGKLIYDVLKCPVRFRNERTENQAAAGQMEGNPSTDGDVLNWASQVDLTGDDAELIRLISECRAFMTRSSLYFDKYPFFVHWETGRIHSNLKQSSTTSRRYAPSNPNSNQIPKRDEEGRKIRKCVVPHKLRAMIVSPDAMSQELRIGADASRDQNFMDCYVPGATKDLHSLVGYEIYKMTVRANLTYEEYEALVKAKDPQAKKTRMQGKTTNFLAQYGGAADTLSKGMVVPKAMAQLFLDARAKAFPGAVKWAEDYQKEIKAKGYATTFLGARKHIHKLIASGIGVAHTLRSGLNFRVQSSAAEQTKLIMGKIWDTGLLQRYDCRLYFPVHDEVVMSVMLEDLPAFCYELSFIMRQQYADMVVPVDSQLSIGPNFCDLTELPWPESANDTTFLEGLKL
jgi:DNA polymerase I-like protein with 3'-5' exonuclease and polymerase domains